MKLHLDKEAFDEFIMLAAEHFKVPEAYIEKDYWVTWCLRNIAYSGNSEDLVFKGGTSLSKAHKLICRFSEDIDLAVCRDGLTGAKIKRLVKQSEQSASKGLVYIKGHPEESKQGNFRKTFYTYPVSGEERDFGHASRELQLEINGLASPEPYSLCSVCSLVAEYLVEHDHTEHISIYDLEPFELNVLDVRRTLVEKIVALVKASRTGGKGELSRKVRHIYDLAMLLRRDEYRRFLGSDYFTDMLEMVRQSDMRQFSDAVQWLEAPFSQECLFSQPEKIWPDIASEYEESFSGMVFGGGSPR